MNIQLSHVEYSSAAENHANALAQMAAEGIDYNEVWRTRK